MSQKAFSNYYVWNRRPCGPYKTGKWMIIEVVEQKPRQVRRKQFIPEIGWRRRNAPFRRREYHPDYEGDEQELLRKSGFTGPDEQKEPASKPSNLRKSEW